MELYKQVNQLFWNGSLFQFIFYACVVMVLILEKRRTFRIVFGLYPFVIIIGIFNPITAAIIHLFLRESVLYYVRLFSVVPVFYCIAHGITLMAEKCRKGFKLFSVCLAATALIITGKCVYGEPWMQRATNVQKTPDEVFSVIDIIPREKENVRVAFPGPLYLYARQVDGNLLMPYGRSDSSNELLDELEKPVPDVNKAMRKAGEESVDYIVVNKNDETRAAFSYSGYEPVGETEAYYIYAVEGVPFNKTQLNGKRQIELISALDSNGIPTYSNTSVITTKVFEYDQWGNKTKEEYFDKDGQPVTTTDGYCGIKKHYIKHRLSWVEDSVIFLDTLGQPLLVSGRYETRFKYLSKKDYIESYYDSNGRLMNRLDTGYAASLKQFNRAGRIISEEYYDADGKAITSAQGYAAYKREYDKKDRVTVERYYDASGNLTDNIGGFAEWFRAYDDSGNLIEERFLDRDGSTVDVKERIKAEASRDLFQSMQKHSVENGVGVNYTWNPDGSCTVNGTAQGISWNTVLKDEKPYFFLNGENYRVEYSAENVYLSISFWEDTTWRNEVTPPLFVLNDAEFTVPQNCGAMSISLYVNAGTHVDETVFPRFFVKQ